MGRFQDPFIADGGMAAAGKPTLSVNLAAAQMPPAGWENTMTVMMRNLPNKYTQRMLLKEINQAGFAGAYDFMYLPIDPDTNANRGYACMNFIDPRIAWMHKVAYEGQQMQCFNSHKVVSVMPATLQGFEANYAHYSSARVNRGDPAARPLFLREPPTLLRGSSKLDNKTRGSRRRNDPNNIETALVPRPASVSPMPQPQPPWPDHGGYQGPRSDLAPPVIPPQAEAGLGQKMVAKFCPQCGGSIQSNFQFCPNCGSDMSLS
jgi:hypothetical protein